MHRVTAAEDFLGDMKDGWLCFESEHEKRRLCAPYPRDWTDMPIPELEQLCSVAPAVTSRKSSTPSGERRAMAARIDRAVSSEGQRIFSSPAGRAWTVRLHDRMDRSGNTERVLRFTAGDIVLDLAEVPSDWMGMTREQFALLVLDADPPRNTPSTITGGPRRRRED